MVILACERTNNKFTLSEIMNNYIYEGFFVIIKNSV